MLFCDASSEGYGGFLDTAGCERTDKSSTYMQASGTLAVETRSQEAELYVDLAATKAVTSGNKTVIYRSPEEDASLVHKHRVSPEVETSKTSGNQMYEGMLSQLNNEIVSYPVEVRTAKRNIFTSEDVNCTEMGQSVSELSVVSSSGKTVQGADKNIHQTGYRGYWRLEPNRKR